MSLFHFPFTERSDDGLRAGSILRQREWQLTIQSLKVQVSLLTDSREADVIARDIRHLVAELAELAARAGDKAEDLHRGNI